MSRILTTREIKPGRPDCLADETVSGEPVCEANSLLTGKLTGKFADSFLSVRFLRPVDQQIQGLAGKFPTQPNREFFEFEQGIESRDQGIFSVEEGIRIARLLPESRVFCNLDSRICIKQYWRELRTSFGANCDDFLESFSMSDDSAYRIAKTLFGLDHGEFDIALDNLNERYLRPIAQIAKILSERLSLFLEAIARELIALAQKIAAAPEIPAYEKLFIEKGGYCPLFAKLI